MTVFIVYRRVANGAVRQNRDVLDVLGATATRHRLFVTHATPRPRDWHRDLLRLVGKFGLRGKHRICNRNSFNIFIIWSIWPRS